MQFSPVNQHRCGPPPRIGQTEDEGDLRLFFSKFLGGPGDGSWSPQAVLTAVDGTPIPSSSRPAVVVFRREALGDEECIIVNVGLRTAEIFPNPGGVSDDPSDPSHPQAGPDARMFFGEFDGDVTTKLGHIPIGFTELQPALAVLPQLRRSPKTNSLRTFARSINLDLSNGIRRFLPFAPGVTVISLRSVMKL